jgi:hypothetical protein
MPPLQLLLPRLCVKISEIGANQMKMVFIKISMISTTKRKTGVLSGVAKMHESSS